MPTLIGAEGRTLLFDDGATYDLPCEGSVRRDEVCLQIELKVMATQIRLGTERQEVERMVWELIEEENRISVEYDGPTIPKLTGPNGRSLYFDDESRIDLPDGCEIHPGGAYFYEVSLRRGARVGYSTLWVGDSRENVERVLARLIDQANRL